MEYRQERGSASLCLDSHLTDHFAPLLSVFYDEISKVGGCHRDRHATEVRKAFPDLRIGEGRVDLLIELIDDLDGSVFWAPDARPPARFVARHEIAHRWDIRQCIRTRRAGHRKGTQLAGSDV